jgi:DnaJ family protein A protein 5
MGQGQSNEGDSTPVQEEQKSDYYDLLGVERDVSEDEIKKAYRRKALELHPDRNYGNVENATKQFAEIQSAYEVLSDPQERAWYDSHRDVLLRGNQGGAGPTEEFSYNIRMTTADEVMKLTMKFNGRLDYSDSLSGFYGGLNEFFKQLAKEEDIACQWDNLEPLDYPEFGLKNDDYDDVVRPFYAAWNGFSTKKSYSWKDEYRLSEAPDRRIRRLMEKENKKLRENGIQEYNDAVRALIAFVRKRDPRFQENQKSEAERQKALRDATAAKAAKARAARQVKLEAMEAESVPDWAKSRTVDEHEGGFSSESEEEEHEYECVVCDKVFKSEAQFHTHEKSKKHLKLLKQMKRDMKVQDQELGLDTNGDGLHDEEVEPHHLEEEPAEHTSEAADIEHPDEKEVEEHPVAKDIGDEPPNTNSETPTDLGAEEAEQDNGSSPENDNEDEDYALRSAIEEGLTNNTADDLPSRFKATVLEDTPAASDTDGQSTPKMGKAAQKRAKKAAQQATGAQDSPADGEFRCVNCQAGFPSKTQLFNHIKKNPSHAAPPSQVKAGGKGKGKRN